MTWASEWWSVGDDDGGGGGDGDDDDNDDSDNTSYLWISWQFTKHFSNPHMPLISLLPCPWKVGRCQSIMWLRSSAQICGFQFIALSDLTLSNMSFCIIADFCGQQLEHVSGSWSIRVISDLATAHLLVTNHPVLLPDLYAPSFHLSFHSFLLDSL